MNIKKHFLVYRGLPKDMYLLFLSVVINKMGSFVTPLLTLILTVKLGLPKTEIGFIATIAMLTQAPSLLIGGSLVDKFGSKKVIIVLHFIGAMIYIICGFLKPNITIVILAIVTSNLYAMASPGFNTIVPLITPSSLVKNAYSLMYLGLNLGLAVGPAIGGILFNYHLSLLFFLDALTTLLSTAFIIFFINDKNIIDKPLLEIEKEPIEPISKNSTILLLYKNPELVIFSIILLVYNFCYIQWNFMLPLQTVNIFKDKGASIFSFLISINAITVIIFTPFLTSITQNIPALRSIFIGGILYFISFVLFSINRFIIIFVIAIIIMTMGEIFISINSNNYIAQRTPKEYMGRVSSILFTVNGMGYAIGPIVMGNLLTFLSIQKAWILVATIMLLGACSMYLVIRWDTRAKKTS